MKKLTMILMTMLLGTASLWAVPAHPGKVKVQQPDGSYVTIRLHGDEWLNFNTTDDGYSIVKDSRGYYVYAEKKDGKLQPTALVAHDEAARTASERAFLTGVSKYQAPEMTEAVAAEKAREVARRAQTLAAHQAARQSGRRAAQYNYNNFKGLIILVQFNDLEFSRSDYKDICTDMVNAENYTGYSSSGYGRFTGSVRDYFSDNSFGLFQPQFDVVGPVTINYSKYYPNKTNNGNTVAKAAINAADPLVNYQDYDRDGDGTVDMVYLIYAGVGSNVQGNNEGLIWPYASYFWNIGKKDNVNFGRYACSTELTGSEQNNVIDGIGTICHEFSHVLGLPDFYDTDYEQSGGESNHPNGWSVMAGGSYENTGRTPVGYSLYERYSVGFCDEPEVIDAEGEYTLDALYLEGKGFRINSPVNNEFFLFENRQKTAFKWDAYLPGSGMLVHRVEKPNSGVWSANTINNNPNHNYYEVIRANGEHKSNYGSYYDTAYDVFPSKGKTALHNNTSPANLKTWSGKSTKWGLNNIKQTNGVITFDIANTYELADISLPATASVGLGLTTQLTPVPNPDFAEYTLTWSSDNNAIATVDQEGNVTGVSVGTANITVESNNGKTATCAVTVEALSSVSVADFKSAQEGSVLLLQLTNAEVLYVYDNTAYIRDATGCIMFNNTGLNLQKNDRINGTMIAAVGLNNQMVQVVGVEGSTNDSGLSITAGAEVKPREVKLEDMTAADYSDYVVVKAVQLERNNGVWAVSGDKRARLWNKFQISGISLPSNITGKYYDIETIYGTDDLNGQQIEELYLLKALVEVPDPGIVPEPVHAYDMSEFQMQTVGEEVILHLNNAEVLYVNGDDVYMRDAYGSIVLSQSGLSLQRNDILNGELRTLVGRQNDMAQALPPAQGWDVSGLSKWSGAEVQPKEIDVEDLDPTHYSDYVQLRDVELTEDGDGMWITKGNRRIRIWKKFDNDEISMPASGTLDGHTYDIEGIYGTDVLYGRIIEEIYLTGSVVDKGSSSAIQNITTDNESLARTYYNIQGQRVAPTTKGMLIFNNKKVIRH